LRCYKLHGDEFLYSIVTEDETWVAHYGKRFSTDKDMKGEMEKWTKGLVGTTLRKA
jgi:hypothetical protein